MDPRDRSKEDETEEQTPDTERSLRPPDLERGGGDAPLTDGLGGESVIIEDDDGDYG